MIYLDLQDGIDSRFAQVKSLAVKHDVALLTEVFPKSARPRSSFSETTISQRFISSARKQRADVDKFDQPLACKDVRLLTREPPTCASPTRNCPCQPRNPNYRKCAYGTCHSSAPVSGKYYRYRSKACWAVGRSFKRLSHKLDRLTNSILCIGTRANQNRHFPGLIFYAEI